MMKKLLIAGLILAGIGATARLQAQLAPECRREIVKLCGLVCDRDAIRSCLRERYTRISKPCLQSMSAMRKDDSPRAAPSGGTEYQYGEQPLQALDFYAGPTGAKSPLIVFVHGGGWKRGDKGNATGATKVRHFREQGYAFATLNYRLVSDGTVEQQAADIANAIAYLHRNAEKLGIDRSRIVLMGHSAGAHLSALVGTDPQYLREAGLDLSALAGIVPIDGAAYDVPAQMKDGPRMMQQTYAQAFGNDPARQRALSPTLQAAKPNARAFLILHVDREDGTRQSEALASALRAAGATVQLEGFDGKGLAGHMAINRQLGNPDYPATPVVDAWLKSVFGR